MGGVRNFLDAKGLEVVMRTRTLSLQRGKDVSRIAENFVHFADPPDTNKALTRRVEGTAGHRFSVVIRLYPDFDFGGENNVLVAEIKVDKAPGAMVHRISQPTNHMREGCHMVDRKWETQIDGLEYEERFGRVRAAKGAFFQFGDLNLTKKKRAVNQPTVEEAALYGLVQVKLYRRTLQTTRTPRQFYENAPNMRVDRTVPEKVFKGEHIPMRVSFEGEKPIESRKIFENYISLDGEFGEPFVWTFRVHTRDTLKRMGLIAVQDQVTRYHSSAPSLPKSSRNEHAHNSSSPSPTPTPFPETAQVTNSSNSTNSYRNKRMGPTMGGPSKYRTPESITSNNRKDQSQASGFSSNSRFRTNSKKPNPRLPPPSAPRAKRQQIFAKREKRSPSNSELDVDDSDSDNDGDSQPRRKRRKLTPRTLEAKRTQVRLEAANADDIYDLTAENVINPSLDLDTQENPFVIQSDEEVVEISTSKTKTQEPTTISDDDSDDDDNDEVERPARNRQVQRRGEDNKRQESHFASRDDGDSSSEEEVHDDQLGIVEGIDDPDDFNRRGH